MQPARPGRLTVATSLPAPGFWTGDDASALTGGFELGIAEAMAERFDLELEVVDVPFERIVGGDLGGADLALAQITRTDERSEVLDFSVPYYEDDAGVVVRVGDEFTDLKTAQESTWVTERDTVEADLLAETVRPDDPPVLVDDIMSCIDAVADGRADAALIDLSSALVITAGRDDVTTGARMELAGEIAVALPEGSANIEVVDAALRALEADGTLDSLAEENLAPVFEVDPDSIPLIRTSS